MASTLSAELRKTMKAPSEEAHAAAAEKIEALCKEHGVSITLGQDGAMQLNGVPQHLLPQLDAIARAAQGLAPKFTGNRKQRRQQLGQWRRERDA